MVNKEAIFNIRSKLITQNANHKYSVTEPMYMSGPNPTEPDVKFIILLVKIKNL